MQFSLRSITNFQLLAVKMFTLFHWKVCCKEISSFWSKSS